MATKFAVISFDFSSLGELAYDPKLDFDFLRATPAAGEALQPVVEAAFAEIRESFAVGISGTFRFGRTVLENVNNYLHMGTSVFFAEVQHSDNTGAQTGTTLVVKFYRLEDNSFKVSVEMEELISAALNYNSVNIYNYGTSNKQLARVRDEIDARFTLNGQIEALPVLKRGRTNVNHYLVSSDERVLEYDFEELVFHQKSEYQDVKVVNSRSLGNVLLLDDLQNLAELDYEYTYTLMDRGNVSYKDKEVLILGGGDGALLYELLKESPKFVTMVEIDQVVMDACIRHMRPFGQCMDKQEGPNHRIVVDDCLKYLRESFASGRRFDVIFSDLTDIPVTTHPSSLTAFDTSLHQKDNPWHFIEAIFNLSLDCLTEGGLYINHATGKGCKQSLAAYEEFLSKSKTLVEWTSRSSYVPSFMEIWVFYTVKRKRLTPEGLTPLAKIAAISRGRGRS